DELADVVLELDRVGGLVVDDGIHGHGHVVLGDDLLGLDVDHLLTHVDLDDPFDERHHPAQTGVDGLLISTEELDQALFEGSHHPESGGGDQDDRGGQDPEEDYQWTHLSCPFRYCSTCSTTSRAPRTSRTMMRAPAGMLPPCVEVARHSSFSTRTTPLAVSGS